MNASSRTPTIGVPREKCNGIAADINPFNEGFSILITNKLSAFGVSVVVAFAAVLVLLVASPLTASATKGVTADIAVTIPNIATGTDRDITLKSTHVSGTELCTEGAFTAVANKAVGGAVAIVDVACTAGTRVTTVTIAMLTTSTSMTVGSTTGFPDSGSAIIAVANTLGAGGATEEIVDYTSKTKTTLDGLTRARAGSPKVAHAIGRTVYPVRYSTLSVGPISATSVTLNVADGTGFVAGTGPELIFAPGKAAQGIEATTVKSGNTFTHGSVGAAAYVIGTYIAQVSAVNQDTATATFTRTASTTTAGSFQFIATAGGEASVKGTVTVSLITDKPDANAASATVTSTAPPTAIPVLIALTGTDVTETAAAPTMAATVLPLKGTLGVIGSFGTPECVDVGTASTRVVGSAMTNCTGMVKYTPLLGATGTDTFEFTFTNGTEISVAALVTITLPPAAPVPVVVPAFHSGNNEPLVVVGGLNSGVYNGGTLVKFDSDCGELSPENITLSATVDGVYFTWVCGAPAFVNKAFTAHFEDGVPKNTILLVYVAEGDDGFFTSGS
jgi:hypothetical protein